MFLIPLGDDVDHREFPMVPTLLTLLNVMVFVYMFRLVVGTRDLQTLHAFCMTWGLVPAELAKGHVVGLVTHMFLHGGIFHIVGNMLCLWAFAQTLELSLGTMRLFALYLLWGVAGGLMHAAASWGSEIPLIGASGAIAGLMGAYWIAFGPLTKIRCFVWVLIRGFKTDIPAGGFMAFWVLMQLLGAAGSTESACGVAWFAHLGGFLAGAGTMLVLKRHAKALVVTRHGNLEFEQPEGPAEADDQFAAAEVESAPNVCPYCFTALGEEHRLAANLLRCPNPACERCIYLEEPAAVP